jgi:outer membrane receptor protein involved in Fe transport
MRSVFFSRVGSSVAAVLASILALSSAAGAQSVPAPMASSAPAAAPAPGATAASMAVISGTVRSTGGNTISGASISISGPVTVTVTSDANGAFSASVPPGIYRIAVRKAGFNGASLADLVATAGTSQPVNVSLSQADLTTLRTIGSVTSSSRANASAINTGAATSTYVAAQAFTNLASPQINDVLERIPDVTIQHMGSQPDTTIIVGGSQPYETQVLIDGHPLALGQYGAWTSQYYPSYLIGGVETQSGPGNTTPFANIAVGGTVNLLTPGFTQKPTAELVYGTDSFASQYSNLLTTGSAGKLQYVVDAGAGGLNGPYYQQNHCDVDSSNPNGTGNVGIIEYCGDSSGSLLTRGENLKLRYNFTPTTSFETGFVGAWGTFAPQGAAWGTSDGPTTIVKCFSGSLECTNPANASLIGSTIPGYTWYPGTFVYNNQTLFDAQLRTSLGNNTLLVRPYLGVIEPEIIDGLYEGQYPQFFAPDSSYPACPSAAALKAAGGPTFTCYPGPQSLAPGTQIPSTGPPNPNAFETYTCTVGNLDSYSQINSPANTLVSSKGQEECFQYPYVTFEQDKLYGSTFSFIHPFGDNFLSFTYDFHGQSTFAYVNAPGNITVPNSTDRYSTFSLTSELHPAASVTVNLGLYDTLWGVVGVQPLYVNGVLALNDGNPELTGLDRHVSRFDPHVATVFRPNADTSIRAAWGTSATFPFVGQVSGNASFAPYATSSPLYTAGSLTEKNPALDPEVSLAYDLGADHRFHNGSVLSGDLQDTIIHNVFQDLEIAEVVPDSPTCYSQPCLLGVSTPINVARLHTEMATLKYRYEPRVGFGFNASVAATRSILTGIPDSLYANSGSAGAFPVNGVQICGNGLTIAIATCIPYLKGYGQLTYTAHGGTYVGLGVEYQGKNNPYFQPPFAQVDLTVRRPVTRNIEFLASVENLLNTNNFLNLPAPNAGEVVTAQNSTGQVGYSTTLIPTPPRTVRVQLRLHMGR